MGVIFSPPLIINSPKGVRNCRFCLLIQNVLSTMKTKTIHREQIAWKLLSRKESGREIAGKKEGFHLPNSVTEDVGGFSLQPSYSGKQLRSMGRRQKSKAEWRLVCKW